MTIETQLSNLDLSRRMKELGFSQDSLYGYFHLPKKKNFKPHDYGEYWHTRPESWKIFDKSGKNKKNYPYEIIAAYSVAELGEMLPAYIKITKEKNLVHSYSKWMSEEDQYFHFEFRKRINGKWTISMRRKCGDNAGKSEYTISNIDSEANARAMMLIYLKEHNII